jgi:hypothetical protein
MMESLHLLFGCLFLFVAGSDLYANPREASDEAAS